MHNTEVLINNKRRVLRGSQISQLNDEPGNYFLRRDPKTDKVHFHGCYTRTAPISSILPVVTAIESSFLPALNKF
jgi:hypothetical protein